MLKSTETNVMDVEYVWRYAPLMLLGWMKRKRHTSNMTSVGIADVVNLNVHVKQ